MIRAIVQNSNDYNNDDYIKNLHRLNIDNEKWNKNLINQRIGEQQFQLLKAEEQKPTIDAIQNKTKEEVVEIIIQEQKPIFNVNKKVIKGKSITPIVKEGSVRGEKYFYINFNLIAWTVNTISPDEVYLTKDDDDILLTDDLKKVIEGNISLADVSGDTFLKYIKLIKDSPGSKKTSYVKKILEILNTLPDYKDVKFDFDDKEGEGLPDGEPILYLPDNPCALFTELSKLISSKKAGHNNVSNHIHAILKRLLELKLISTNKYEKIIDKYL